MAHDPASPGLPVPHARLPCLSCADSACRRRSRARDSSTPCIVIFQLHAPQCTRRRQCPRQRSAAEQDSIAGTSPPGLRSTSLKLSSHRRSGDGDSRCSLSRHTRVVASTGHPRVIDRYARTDVILAMRDYQQQPPAGVGQKSPAAFAAPSARADDENALLQSSAHHHLELQAMSVLASRPPPRDKGKFQLTCLAYLPLQEP